MRLGPGGVRLDRRDIAEPVDDDAGQPRRPRHGPAGRTARRRAVRAGPAPGVSRAANQSASMRAAGSRSSMRAMIFDFGLTVTRPSGAAFAILQHRKRARSQRHGAPVGDQFVGIDPGKPVADGARVGLWAQAHDWAGSGRRPSLGPRRADLSPLDGRDRSGEGPTALARRKPGDQTDRHYPAAGGSGGGPRDC